MKLKNDLQVDVRMLERSAYGAALHYFTGSKEHNVALRDRAKRQGWKLNEYGLFHGEKRSGQPHGRGDLRQASASPGFPRSCGKTWAKSRRRKKASCPSSSNWATFAAICKCTPPRPTATPALRRWPAPPKLLGYQYILITDHSKAVTVANGLDEKRAAEHIRRIHAARKKVKGIEIWAGSEVDILGDGSLDYSDELLKQFDIVLASVHSRMTMPAEEMTTRLLRALENPYVRILGHPTGRLILRRDPFLFDLEKVFAAAKKFGVILEVNASPERLDLCDRHVRLARDRGMKVIISTDAHDPQHFKLMRYGVTTARRGWMEKSGVLNTLPPEKLLASLRPLPR